MRLSNAYGLNDHRVLTGIFRNDSHLYQALGVLTDFGYPKEASKVIRLKSPSEKIKIYGRNIIAGAKDKTVLRIGIAAVLVLGSAVAGSFLYSRWGLSQIALLITFGMVFLIIGVLVCGLIGAAITALINLVMAEESMAPQKNTVEKENVLIIVDARTQNDARDIAREWKDIGGNVLDRS